MPDALAHLNGWLDHPQRHTLAGQLPKFADVARPLLQASGDDDSKSPVLLYKAFHDVLGGWPGWVPQQIGDCVSFGHAHAADAGQCIDIALNQSGEFKETSTEFIYATSREVAGILGRGDGSYGSAAVKAMRTIGVVSREMVPDGSYKGSRAKQWGRTGAPADLKAKAADYRIVNAALVSTWADLVASIRSGYPVTICSNQGFNNRRDANGFATGFGFWPHCMLILGVRFDLEGACIFNSWDPSLISGPTALGQWEGSFWATRRTVERILSAGDSWAISGTPLFVKRDLPRHWSYSIAA